MFKYNNKIVYGVEHFIISNNEMFYFFNQKLSMPIRNIMEGYFQPSGWLGVIVGSNYYYDFSGKYPFKSIMQKLLQDVQRHLQNVTGNSLATSIEPSLALEKYSIKKSKGSGTKHKIKNTLYK